MSDVVDRLKNYIPGEHEQFVPEVNALAVAEIERLRNVLRRIANGGTSVLITAALDECPVNPDVLQQIVKEAKAALAVPSDHRGSE